GKGCVLLGAGRRTMEDVIDPAVGVIVRKKLGNPVTAGDTILEIHYNDTNKRKEALPLFQSAIKINPDPIAPPSLIKKVLV
ncbi:MAG: pyrimidine-nucleoside phosphorylase, partial [SAR324 cluster bacterium]|nr:pyrimidine-nucleoside phosphorylase [SAR324 cluster bacterium]